MNNFIKVYITLLLLFFPFTYSTVNAQKAAHPTNPVEEGARMLAQNCCYTIHEERDVSDSFHLCPEAFDL